MKRVAVAGVLTVVLGAGLAAFEPWTYWTRSTVVEALPTVASSPSTPTARPGEATTVVPPAEPDELSRGDFVTQEHPTRGVARLIELRDGSRVVRIEGFSTRNGPDLVVMLSAETAGGDWFKYEGATSIPLGELKGTDGDQNYDIPADADLSGIRSVVIWCDRFNVSFGSAPVMT